MPIDDPNDLERIDQEIRINASRKRARELERGQMAFYEDPDCPSDVDEQLWRELVAYEEGPFTTVQRRLEEKGLTFPSPDNLDDSHLQAKLWELIHGLASLRHFVEGGTNHLSDRDLYARLYEDILPGQIPDIPLSPDVTWHINFISNSDVEVIDWLRYYADDEDRCDWLKQFPDEALPTHGDPPYDRDRYLPRCDDPTSGWVTHRRTSLSKPLRQPILGPMDT